MHKLAFAKAAVMTGVNQPFEIREYELVPPPQGMAKLQLVARAYAAPIYTSTAGKYR